jgi:soluble lytic murein transglycosylase-like protein
MVLELLAASLLAQQDEVRQKMEESIAKQKASIQKQIGSAGFFTPGWFTTPSATTVEDDCPALTPAEVDPLILSASKTHAVDPALLRAVMRQESGFRPCAVSPKGAQGLMQLMPGTAEELGVQDVFNAEQNLNAGARYLKQLLGRFKGDLKLALAAYNAGPGKVDGDVPEIQETKDYVTRILKAVEGEKKKN